MLLKIVAATKIDPGGLPKTDSDTAITQILQITFGVIGALAVLIIVIAGLRYISAAGDPSKTAQAKNTILLALVGLVVAVFAEALVAFVVRRIG